MQRPRRGGAAAVVDLGAALDVLQVRPQRCLQDLSGLKDGARGRVDAPGSGTGGEE